MEKTRKKHGKNLAFHSQEKCELTMINNDTYGCADKSYVIYPDFPAYFICIKVNGPFVQTFCIEKDSYMDAI